MRAFPLQAATSRPCKPGARLSIASSDLKVTDTKQRLVSPIFPWACPYLDQGESTEMIPGE